MNWIIFTTECSGKSYFLNKNNRKLNSFKIIEWDKVITIPDSRYENEMMLLNILIEADKTNDIIYLTNIIPPNFILSCKEYFNNIKFGIILIDETELKNNIVKRHHTNYNSNYIIENYKKLENIVNSDDNKLKVFKSFDEFKTYFEPKTLSSSVSIKRIIRL